MRLFQIGPGEITGLGSTGLLAYLVIKEILAYTNKRQNGKKSGDMESSYWELKFMEIVEKQTEPLMENQKRALELLDRVLEKQTDTNFVIAKLLMRGVRPSPREDE